jgi:hypothetical protein
MHRNLYYYKSTDLDDFEQNRRVIARVSPPVRLHPQHSQYAYYNALVLALTHLLIQQRNAKPQTRFRHTAESLVLARTEPPRGCGNSAQIIVILVILFLLVGLLNAAGVKSSLFPLFRLLYNNLTQFLPRLPLRPDQPIRRAFPPMTSLRTRDKHHHLLPQPPVFADLFAIYIRLKRLISRLMKLCAHRLHSNKMAYVAGRGGRSLIITHHTVYAAPNRRHLELFLRVGLDDSVQQSITVESVQILAPSDSFQPQVGVLWSIGFDSITLGFGDLVMNLFYTLAEPLLYISVIFVIFLFFLVVFSFVDAFYFEKLRAFPARVKLLAHDRFPQRRFVVRPRLLLKCGVFSTTELCFSIISPYMSSDAVDSSTYIPIFFESDVAYKLIVIYL